MAKTSGRSSGSSSRSSRTPQSASMSRRASSMAESMRRPSRSSLISLSVSTSRLSYWTTTRPGIVARSSGAMSTSGAAVTSMPPVWIERCRGKPSRRAHSSSQRSHGERPAVLPWWRPASVSAPSMRRSAGRATPDSGSTAWTSPRSQATLTGVSPGPPSSSVAPRRPRRPWPGGRSRRPMPSTNPRRRACAAPARPAATAATSSPGARKNSAKPPSASRSRRTITESYVSSALATRSTSGRGKPSA